MLVFFIVILLVCWLMYLLNILLSFKDYSSMKYQTFESGVSSMFPARKEGISLHFFFIVMIFVLFDLEILILFNFLMKWHTLIIINWVLIYFFFTSFLVLTLILEWSNISFSF